MGQARKWTEKENKFLVTAIKSGNTAAEIARFLGRSEKSVQEHCRRLRIVVAEIKEKQNTASFTEVDVKCPFFEKLHLGKSIRCEGLIPSGYIAVGFAEETEWQNHVKEYCNKNYKSCPVNKLLQSLWENKNQ